VIAVGASYNYSLALTSAGQVWAWGHNGSGQLGDGTRTERHIPVRVKLPKGLMVTAIAAGGFDGLALTAAGQLLAWGDNGFGQLGNGTRHSSSIPVRVKLRGCKGARGERRRRLQARSYPSRPHPDLGAQSVRAAGQRHHDQHRHPRQGENPSRTGRLSPSRRPDHPSQPGHRAPGIARASSSPPACDPAKARFISASTHGHASIISWTALRGTRLAGEDHFRCRARPRVPPGDDRSPRCGRRGCAVSSR